MSYEDNWLAWGLDRLAANEHYDYNQHWQHVFAMHLMAIEATC